MEARVYGYVRVSTKEQNADRQYEALRQYGVPEDNILTDKCSGKDTEREAYKALRNVILRRGDTLVVKEIDRLIKELGIKRGTYYTLIKRESEGRK